MLHLLSCCASLPILWSGDNDDLNDIPPGILRVPQGSEVTLRLYGEVGALTVSETVSGRTGEVAPAMAAVT